MKNKNSFIPSVYNIGFLGNATRKNNEKLYEFWKCMLRRCYYTKDASSIGKCCRGKALTAGTYKWEYKIK